MSKKTHSMIVWMCCPNYLVYSVKISFCDPFLQYNDDAYEVNVLLLINLSQKTQEVVSNVEIAVTK